MLIVITCYNNHESLLLTTMNHHYRNVFSSHVSFPQDLLTFRGTGNCSAKGFLVLFTASSSTGPVFSVGISPSISWGFRDFKKMRMFEGHSMMT